eukprot:4733958-Amphidinium_carterae.2
MARSRSPTLSANTTARLSPPRSHLSPTHRNQSARNQLTASHYKELPPEYRLEIHVSKIGNATAERRLYTADTYNGYIIHLSTEDTIRELSTARPATSHTTPNSTEACRSSTTDPPAPRPRHNRPTTPCHHPRNSSCQPP